MNLANRPAHVHGAIEDRLPPEVNKLISKLMPPQFGKRDMTSEEILRYKKAYASIQDVIFEHFASTNGASRHSWCYLHHAECNTFTDVNGSRPPKAIHNKI